MRSLQVEIVVGTIQVGRQHRDEVGTVLQVIALTQIDTGDLGNCIGLVGLFVSIC